jgi:uncharacterized protein
MKLRLRQLLLIIGLCVAMPMLPSCTQARSDAAVSNLDETSLSIRTVQGDRKFRVEIARSFEEQQRGMMFRQSIAADRGMIFPLKPEREASFWMKNTLIPLDMIFIRKDGTIARIAPEAVPHSLEPVSSGEPVVAVLELAGGEAAKQGIAEGDLVIWNDPKG